MRKTLTQGLANSPSQPAEVCGEPVHKTAFPVHSLCVTLWVELIPQDGQAAELRKRSPQPVDRKYLSTSPLSTGVRGRADRQ